MLWRNEITRHWEVLIPWRLGCDIWPTPLLSWADHNNVREVNHYYHTQRDFQSENQWQWHQRVWMQRVLQLESWESPFRRLEWMAKWQRRSQHLVSYQDHNIRQNSRFSTRWHILWKYRTSRYLQMDIISFWNRGMTNAFKCCKAVREGIDGWGATNNERGFNPASCLSLVKEKWNTK